MPLAGWCDVDNDWVWLEPDGSCVNGHGPEHISRVYDTDERFAPPVEQEADAEPEPSTPPVSQFPAAPPVAPPAASPGAGPRRTASSATLALVLGLASIFCCVPILTVPAGIAGLIFGVRGLGSPQRGIAIAAIVLSSFGLTFGILNALGGLWLALNEPEAVQEMLRELQGATPNQ